MRIEDACHEDGDRSRGVELPRALPLSFGELPQQIFIRPPENVRLHVIQPEAVLRVVEDLDEVGQPPVVDDPLPRRCGVEVRDVDDAREARILTGDGPNRIGQELTKSGGRGRDPGPAGVLWNVEPDQLMVLLDQLRCCVPIPELLSEVCALVVEDIGEPLQEDQGKDVVLELGGVERPSDLAGRVPEPVFECGNVESLTAHSVTSQLSLTRTDSRLITELGRSGVSRTCP